MKKMMTVLLLFVCSFSMGFAMEGGAAAAAGGDDGDSEWLASIDIDNDIQDLSCDGHVLTDDESALLALAENFDPNTLEEIRQLLERGVDVNVRSHCGQTAINWATLYGRKDVVELLLTHGADPNIPGRAGWITLHEAVSYWGGALGERPCNPAEIIPVLVEAGARVDAQDKSGRTPLFLALDYHTGHVNIAAVQALLNAGADVHIKIKESRLDSVQSSLDLATKNHTGTEIERIVLEAAQRQMDEWHDAADEIDDDDDVDVDDDWIEVA